MGEENLLVAQGVGPTAVINQSLVGVILEARNHPSIDRIYGALHGVDGIVGEDFVDLTDIPADELEAIALTPAAALGSTRSKPDADFCERIFEVCQKRNIRHFLYIGGNDSSDTLRIVNEASERVDYDLRCIHVPKTIDNDLMVNDHTPGFGSAARFVASAFAGVNLDNAALPGVYIAVVMGRHAGFLTAASALAREVEGDGPHLIYVPERTFDTDQFIADVKTAHAKYGRCMVAVSEGIHDASGTPMLAQLAANAEYDAHGNVQLSGSGALADLLVKVVKENTGITRVRADTFGYLQRSFLGCASNVDQCEARGVGIKAVQAAVEGHDGTITIHRLSSVPYTHELRVSPLESVAGLTRVMPDEFIAPTNNDVTDAFLTYVRPLVGTDFPTATRLNAPKVD